jgi:hypothetical protein
MPTTISGPVPGPLVIHRDAIYSEEQLRIYQGLDGPALGRARRSGALRALRIGRSWWFMGSWILDWFERSGSAPGAEGLGDD